jgi:hypothetical protein
MDGLLRAIGDGIAGFWSTAFDTLGRTAGGLVNSVSQALPGGLGLIVVAALVVLVGLKLLTR